MCFATQVPSSGSDEEREPFAVAMALTQGFEVVHSRDCPNPVQGLPGKHMGNFHLSPGCACSLYLYDVAN